MKPYQSHTRNLQKALAAHSYHAAFIQSPSDLLYLTDLKLDGVFAFITPHTKMLFVPRMLRFQVREAVGSYRIREYTDIVKTVQHECRKQRIKQVWFDAQATSAARAARFRSIPSLRSHFTPSVVLPLRCIKDHDEIVRIRKACSISVRMMHMAKRWMTGRTRESTVARNIQSFFLKHNAQQAFDTIVAAGSNTSKPHHQPTSKKISKNTAIIIDAGAQYHGYCADLTRSFYLGKMNEFYSQIYRLVYQAKTHALSMVRDGTKARDIDRAVRALFTKAGFGKYFVHSTGHGVGIDVHEPPRIGPKSTDVLKSGMVITIEPGLYFPGRFGIRMEDTLLVTDTGCRILSAGG
ncbi:MAG: M24 family metallopeptidase [Elusimicrobia bacterium]|nr:M24 family metallopeptidase [Elusimicrobiota bacterium]MBD3411821.1 M24 family metallopeptidase [Elusimicrobiota bacterium]